MLNQNIISVKNLDFSYNDVPVFYQFNLDIKAGQWVSIVGPNGSGKSTLIKILAGLIKTDNYININGFLLDQNNLIEIRKSMGFVFENPDNQFVAETVMDDLAFSLENLGYSALQIKNKIEEVSTLLNLKDILEVEPHLLSGGQKQLVSLGAALMLEPKILIMDEGLSYVDPSERDHILHILQQLHETKHLTIITVTHDLEETLYADRIIALAAGKVVLDGPSLEVYSQDKILNRLGLSLPFMVDLSLKLKLYGLIDHIILNMNEMVDELWK